MAVDVEEQHRAQQGLKIAQENISDRTLPTTVHSRTIRSVVATTRSRFTGFIVQPTPACVGLVYKSGEWRWLSRRLLAIHSSEPDPGSGTGSDPRFLMPCPFVW